MHHTIQIVDFTEPIRLSNNTIDNRDGATWVGLLGQILCNVHKNERILRQIMNRNGNTTENYQSVYRTGTLQYTINYRYYPYN